MDYLILFPSSSGNADVTIKGTLFRTWISTTSNVKYLGWRKLRGGSFIEECRRGL